MRFVLLRSALAVGVGLLALATLSAGVGAATGGQVTVTGSAPAAVSGPATITFSYSVSLPTAVTFATFTTHQDARLPALATGAELDGVRVAAGAVSRIGALDVSVNAGAAGLRAGQHVLTVQASAPGGDAASTSSYVSFGYRDASGPQTRSSAPVIVAINQPDLAVALTVGVGQSPGVLARLGTGRVAAVAVDVSNVGVGNPNANLVLTFPVGLQLAQLGVTQAGQPVPCGPVPGHSNQQSCPLGTVSPAAATSLVIAVTTTAHPPVGEVASLGVAVQPSGAGVDADPANNATQLAMRFTGVGRLSSAVRVRAATVRMGGVETVTMTVRNGGTESTNRTVGLLTVDSQRLRILAFSRAALPAAQSTPTALAQSLSPGFATLSPGASFASAGLQPAAAGPAAGNGVAFDFGPLTSGQSVSATLTVRAVGLGGTPLSFGTVSDLGDPACDQLRCPPSTASVRVVPAAVTPPAASRPTTPAVVTKPGASATASPASAVPDTSVAVNAPVPATPELASTGATTFNGSGVGFGLVVFGLALLTAVRRRPARARHGR